MPVNPRVARSHDPATRVAEDPESGLEDGNCLGRPGNLAPGGRATHDRVPSRGVGPVGRRLAVPDHCPRAGHRTGGLGPRDPLQARCAVGGRLGRVHLAGALPRCRALRVARRQPHPPPGPVAARRPAPPEAAAKFLRVRRLRVPPGAGAGGCAPGRPRQGRRRRHGSAAPPRQPDHAAAQRRRGVSGHDRGDRRGPRLRPAQHLHLRQRPGRRALPGGVPARRRPPGRGARPDRRSRRPLQLALGDRGAAAPRACASPGSCRS